MLTLLTNVRCRWKTGDICDMLLAGGAVECLTAPGTIRGDKAVMDEIDCAGLDAYPGFVDQHMHFAGAGGEEGFKSRSAELPLGEILRAGVTTAVGLLGADGITRGLENLYAKAKALEEEGLTTYMYTGSYTVMPVTLTGSVARDMTLIDKVIGAGELAVSDHRSSNPNGRMIAEVASGVHLGALLTGKAGVVHLHIGEGKDGLIPLLDALKLSDLPKEAFVPTHVNRNRRLFREAADYAKDGGNIDLTAGEKDGIPVPLAVAELMDERVPLDRVTVSSDAGGSIPSGGVGGAAALLEDFRTIIRQSVLPPEQAIHLFSKNPAKNLKLYPRKGSLEAGSDADILLTDGDGAVRKVFCKGRLLLDENG